jgi:formate hydrogenlyase subunit 3/multisubunit Na+/H+ antiporter MnhD subunit
VTAPALLLSALLLPLLLAGFLLSRRTVEVVRALLPFSTWPVAIAGVAAQGAPPGEFPLLFGIGFGMGGPELIFLLTGTVIWTVAGCQCRAMPPFFLGSALAAQTGSLGALAALDPVGFYFFFSVMTLASYGLVLGRRSEASHRAARLYLSMALLGELIALTALMLAQSRVGAEAVLPIGLLLLFGLGAKLGVPPFHFVLPVAYRCAPLPGAALLASVLVNAAIMGLIRLMPLSDGNLAPLAPFLCHFGLVTAFAGALAGMLQRNPCALLGYSTVSQMGILVAGLGIAAVGEGGPAALIPALMLFATHHALVKAALFLAYDGLAGRVRLVILTLLSLALAAAPVTGGAIAKLWMEEGVQALPAGLSERVHLLLPLTSAGTALLMARFVHLAARRGKRRQRTPLPVVALVALALIGPPVLGAVLDPALLSSVLTPAQLWKATWPLLGAALLLLVARMLPGRFKSAPWRTGPAVRTIFRLRLPTGFKNLPERLGEYIFPGRNAGGLFLWKGRMAMVEHHLRGMRAVGLLYFLLILAMALLAGLFAVPVPDHENVAIDP